MLAEQTQKDFKAEEVIEKIAKYQNEDINLTSPSKLYITLSMINKNVLKYYYYSSITALLFGTDCLSYLEYISGRETAPGSRNLR